VSSLLELLRIASQVRVFPLRAIDAKEVLFLNEVIERLEASGYDCKKVKVSYAFQKEADEMLVIDRS
jgi:hypothetical protein